MAGMVQDTYAIRQEKNKGEVLTRQALLATHTSHDAH